MMDNVRKI